MIVTGLGRGAALPDGWSESSPNSTNSIQRGTAHRASVPRKRRASLKAIRRRSRVVAPLPPAETQIAKRQSSSGGTLIGSALRDWGIPLRAAEPRRLQASALIPLLITPLFETRARCRLPHGRRHAHLRAHFLKLLYEKSNPCRSHWSRWSNRLLTSFPHRFGRNVRA